MNETTKDWNLLNAAQAIIPKLSEAQKAALIRGQATVNTTHPVLHRLGLVIDSAKANGVYNLIPTPLGEKVIDVLKGRQP